MGSPPSAAAVAVVVLVFLSPFVARARDSADPYLARIPYDLYHSSDGLLTEIRELVDHHPDIFTMEIMQAGNKNYSAEVLIVTYSNVKRESYNDTEIRILLSFGQHGRELITSEVALRLLYLLSGEHTMFNINPFSRHGKSTMGNFVIKVVPMENLNGRKLVENGDLCERRNGRGVDLNRNWSVDWGKKEKDFDPYEEYPGPVPFSEPEVQIMRKLSRSFNPHIWVNIHSGMEALFMPYDHKNTTPKGLPSQVMKSLLEKLNHNHCHGRCLIGSGGGSVGYLAHGTATDYMYDIVRVPLAFTFEIYGDSEASSKDCFRMFNPVDRTTFNRILNDWSSAFVTMFHSASTQLEKLPVKLLPASDELIPIGSSNTLDGSWRGRQEERRVEGLDLGIQELRYYFRLFLLSSVLLLFMFCSRISKSKCIPVKALVVVS